MNSESAGPFPICPASSQGFSFTRRAQVWYPKCFIMRTVDLIQRKRDGEELSPDEILFVVDGYTRGEIPDYQMSAFLMAVYFKGMTDREVSQLTDCMMRSGETLDLSEIQGVKVDKHSTGGVGDKTTLIVAPLAAAADVIVPTMG